MKKLLGLFFIVISLFGFSTLFAQSSVMYNNMQVIQDGDPTRCNASWNGRADQEDVTRYGAGENDSLSGPVIRSCVGCSMMRNNQSQACVCKKCYDYFQ